MTEYAAKKIVDKYFDADDLNHLSWDKKQEQGAIRIKKYIDKADWDKAPEGLNRLIVAEFFKKIIEKMS